MACKRATSRRNQPADTANAAAPSVPTTSGANHKESICSTTLPAVKD